MVVSEIIGEALIIVGMFFYIVSGLGLIRMPDLYSRMQTATKTTTMGTIFTFLGIGIMWPEHFLKIFIVMLFILFTNPVAAHALARGAYRSGIRPWKGTVIDKYKEKLGEGVGIDD
ncbi:MAG TPA: Na+/H+ antiporter subunit G [Euryarchaeota archaeon]|nr:Na+/H+ antiporter subunit G [Euryarchaeota archaeon]